MEYGLRNIVCFRSLRNPEIKFKRAFYRRTFKWESHKTKKFSFYRNH